MSNVLDNKIFGVTGWKNSGKTTLVVKLVSHFVAQGLRVGTIKRAHCGFDIDHPDTDSFRHRQAGAQQVIIASNQRWAMMHELENSNEVPLSELLMQFKNLDLVLIEGYKSDTHPKIQAVRPSISLTSMKNKQAQNIVALAVKSATNSSVSAVDLGCTGPVLDLDDIKSIADYIRNYLDL